MSPEHEAIRHSIASEIGGGATLVDDELLDIAIDHKGLRYGIVLGTSRERLDRARASGRIAFLCAEEECVRVAFAMWGIPKQ